MPVDTVLTERLMGNIAREANVVHEHLALIKEGDVVDDEACDRTNEAVQRLMGCLGELAEHLGHKPFPAPPDLERSPYQYDDDVDPEGNDESSPGP